MPTPILAKASEVTLGGRAAQRRHRAPERKGERDDVAAVEPVGDARDGNAEQGIEQREAEASEQAHHDVADENSFLIGSIRTLKIVRSRKFSA